MQANNYSQITTQLRKKRSYVTLETLTSIKSMLSKGKSAKEISEFLCLSLKAVYNWMEKLSLETTDQDDLGKLIRKPGRIASVTSLINIRIFETIQADNSLTQNGIKHILSNSNIQVSQSAISVALKNMGITRKRLVKIVEQKNEASTISLRKNFAIRYRHKDKQNLLYLDETAFNIHTSKRYGYSPVNTPAKIIVPTACRNNVSLLAIISTKGILHSKIIIGASNSLLLDEFLNECLTMNVFMINTVVLMDNIRFHETEILAQFFREHSLYFDFLPPHSPELNPIEEVFNCLRTRYHEKRPRATNTNTLKHYVTEAISEINTDTNFCNFFTNMSMYMDRAFREILF
ncbi:hypothetical protein MXB_3585 [Myxobolus squamalis]|nr:hypothetical protein MXB_3585 [Myxobolus squamalis]